MKPTLLPGYNHNIRHRDLLFHVQTEDSGETNPYIVTTLFYEGNVMALRRSSYAKFVAAENREEIVRSMMQEQHKEMMKDLISDRIRNVTSLFPGVEFNPKTEKVDIPVVATPAEPAKKPIAPAPATSEKTLDELILEFLNSEKQGKS